MISVKNSVIEPTLNKVANYELPKNVAEWNEEILDQFFEQVNYLPKEFGVEIVVKNVDENDGYAKGSIVVSYQGKQVNFPVIVKDFKLSPFDVFVYKEKDETKFNAATLDNIKKILASVKIGEIENKIRGGQYPGVKRPGGILPKDSVNVHDLMNSYDYPEFSKMSAWPVYAREEDMDKLAIQMESDADVKDAFVDNTGDLIGNIVELNKNNKRIIGDDHKEGILDLKNVVKAKRAITVLDSQLFDVNSLKPIEAPAVCEVRLHCYPTMEDYIESGENMAGRFLATMNGKAISGIVVDYKSSYDLSHRPERVEPATCCDSDGTKEKKKVRNRRDQIFISLDGKYYCRFNDYDKHGIGFYGSSILGHDKAMEKAVKLIDDNTTDNFTNINRDNKNDGSDKLFKPNEEKADGKKDNHYGCTPCGSYGELFVIYGSGDAYECVSFDQKFRKYKVNDTNVFVSNEEAIIPANVAGGQRVSAVKDPVYKMILGKVNNIYLVPEGAKIINASFMKSLGRDDIMRPDTPICKNYEDANINKVALLIQNNTYTITGKPLEPLMKIAKIDGSGLNTTQVLATLHILGVDGDTAKTAMKVALNRATDKEAGDKSVNIWGVRDDYINIDVVKELEKRASVKKILKQICENMRVDLIKEASSLDDPEAVDVVLSLNFINEDSLRGYIDNLREMKKISGNLAELLIASRMGLKDIDENSAKKAMEGLNKVILDLEQVKMAID